jgi:hypothetical protein
MGKHCTTVHEKVRAHKCRYCNSRLGTASATTRKHCTTVHEKVRDHACP